MTKGIERVLHRLLTLASLLLLAFSAWRLYGYPLLLSVRARTYPGYTSVQARRGPPGGQPSVTPAPEPREALSPVPGPDGASPRRLLLEIPKTGLKWVVGVVTEESREPCGIPQKTLDKYGIVLSPRFSYPGGRGVAVLAAHRYRMKPFAELDRLAPGDPIVVGLPDGTFLRYLVECLRVVPPDEIGVLDPVIADRPELRLITCLVGSNAKRLVIYGRMEGR